ncbi:methyl-accepting chemotaxis protein I [Vibrio maritimus]|uniref:Methyl-accepting chemotaxis protein I n=1 Tax=Vibrio maritimus TaxID=990268 RepID=A0A090SSD8_9VIBR|nr:methyl-accepting chemotaxis protein I [Vibrio maritimus]
MSDTAHQRADEVQALASKMQTVVSQIESTTELASQVQEQIQQTDKPAKALVKKPPSSLSMRMKPQAAQRRHTKSAWTYNSFLISWRHYLINLCLITTIKVEP